MPSTHIELSRLSGGTLTTEDVIMSEDSYSRNGALMRETSSMDSMISSSWSYRSSYLRSCVTFQNFCFCVQFINCGLICILIALVVQEYPKIEELEQQLETDKTEIANLEDEVREKQEGQIQALHQEVKQEQQFNFLTLAGTFTLLTCLISMFHISTHLQKMNQPKIQRKIIAILWMSPIYSLTSFFTLWFPSIGGWMVIIKDFYEGYCIYTFLSFLIVVLGEGSREKAVDVLAKHASHLEKPNRCLSRFYNPPPDVSDHSKANAVITECQIYGMQFTFLRPITSIIFVLINRNNAREQTERNDTEDDYNTSNQDGNTLSDIKDDGSFTNEESASQSSTSTSVHAGNHSGSRFLQVNKGNGVSNTSNGTVDGEVGSSFLDGEGDVMEPSHAPIEGSFVATLAPSVVGGIVSTLVPTIVGRIADNNTIGPYVPSIAPTLPLPDEESAFMQSTEAYFKSPSFALAMVVNVSVFFAFTGLLKFYHAVRDDLAWIRPWPKFLTIKGVVFLTFWQGLAILIFVVVLADPSEKEDATLRAHQYQDMLICLEMLFFSITHWCVFPAEEWEPDYQPTQMESPGLGIKDFVDDVGHIVQNRNTRRKSRRRITRRKKVSIASKMGGKGSNTGGYGGVYQQPGLNGTNSAESDGSFETNEYHHDAKTNEPTSAEGSIMHRTSVRFGELPGAAGMPSPDKRDRSMSDGTGGGFKADDELDSDDPELL